MRQIRHNPACGAALDETSDNERVKDKGANLASDAIWMVECLLVTGALAPFNILYLHHCRALCRGAPRQDRGNKLWKDSWQQGYRKFANRSVEERVQAKDESRSLQALCLQRIEGI